MTERKAKHLTKIRDIGKCVMCSRGGVWHLHVHHIKPKALYPDLAADIANMITLCLHCHLGIIHGGRISDGGETDGRWRKFVFWCKWMIR